MISYVRPAPLDGQAGRERLSGSAGQADAAAAAWSPRGSSGRCPLACSRRSAPTPWPPAVAQAVYGTTAEQLAQIPVDTAGWAALNPKARFRKPLTVDDVLSSPLVPRPSTATTAASSPTAPARCVLTSAERLAASAAAPGLRPRCRHRPQPPMISQMPDLTVTAGSVSGPKAFELAVCPRTTSDVAELYDSFTITVLLALEDLGFCPKGEGGPFVAEGRLGPGGSLPGHLGGGLSYTQPGMFGMFLLVESRPPGPTGGGAPPGPRRRCGRRCPRGRRRPLGRLDRRPRNREATL